ncbi:DUF5635 domain-containing protein [Pseudonocardia kongjuensis]|uniref:DUF5635 domain-containing protein n=1 Tax=Pseudonocardia kongjuensis TaxID=102227 RepID=UPI0031CF9B39
MRNAVRTVLGKLSAGVLPDDVERQQVDLKEEAGRRGRGGALLPALSVNPAAADHLADEVACFANTPGGGALIVGVENRSGDLLGTELETDWLRHAIYTRVDIAPAIEVEKVSGARLLVVYVAGADEPVEDTGGRLRWRVGSHCAPVDRAEWWLHRQERRGFDSMAVATDRTVVDATPGAVLVARRYLAGRGHDELASAPISDLLRRLGALRPDDRLTQAGALLFCAADRTHLSVSVIEVEGGDVLLSPSDLSGWSVLEQLAWAEDRLEAVNTEITLTSGFARPGVRRLPPDAVREAVVNGLAHRDWHSPEPVSITWVQADSALQILSPGGFTGGVTSDTVLTARHARHPALADLFRALDLVEKQGLGVDRMYREMVVLGHRPPLIVEEAGPRIRLRLVGGEPVVPVMALTTHIDPPIRRQDVRIALIIDHLLRRPIATAAGLAPTLQRTPAEAAEALETAAECRIVGEPLVVRFKEGWILSKEAIAVVERAGRADDLRARGILGYRKPDDPRPVVRAWFASHDRLTSGDYARLTGLTTNGARSQLERLVVDGMLVRGDERGRNAHFVVAPG